MKKYAWEQRGENEVTPRLRIVNADELMSRRISSEDHLTDVSCPVCLLVALIIGSVLLLADVRYTTSLLPFGLCKGGLIWACIAAFISFAYFSQEKIPFKRMCAGSLCVALGSCIPFQIAGAICYYVRSL